MPAACSFGLHQALAEGVGSGCRLQTLFERWECVPGKPFSSGQHQSILKSLRHWRQLREEAPTVKSLLTGHGLVSRESIFTDDLLDVIVPDTDE